MTHLIVHRHFSHFICQQWNIFLIRIIFGKSYNQCQARCGIQFVWHAVFLCPFYLSTFIRIICYSLKWTLGVCVCVFNNFIFRLCFLLIRSQSLCTYVCLLAQCSFSKFNLYIFIPDRFIQHSLLYWAIATEFDQFVIVRKRKEKKKETTVITIKYKQQSNEATNSKNESIECESLCVRACVRVRLKEKERGERKRSPTHTEGGISNFMSIWLLPYK